ncbi:MAG: hypothetical protein HY840_07985 [Bacteroidetes bacterium]|nr:hypothetical protein [Bacteroidota bacterium]
MKKHFLFPVLTGAVALSLTFSGCGSSGEKKQEDTMPVDTSKGVSAMAHDSTHHEEASLVYICPCGGCPEVRESKAGNCRKCGLELEIEK